MKYLRFSGLIGALALASVSVMAGAASATVLCKEAKNPCGTADYPAETALSAELVPSNSVRWKGSSGETIDACTTSTFSGKTKNTGGAKTAVSIALSSLEWKSCTTVREVAVPGELEVSYFKSEPHVIATLTIKGTEWKEGSCVYGAGSVARSAGWVTEPTEGRSYTVFDMQVTFPKISGLFCEASQTWEGEYRFTTPSTLYIAES
jgi:hypothetical protein